MRPVDRCGQADKNLARSSPAQSPGFCSFGFLTSPSTTRLYRGRAPRQSVGQFYVLPHMRQSWQTMTSDSASHIILTPTQPVGSGRPQRESNPGPPLTRSRALYRLTYGAPPPAPVSRQEQLWSKSPKKVPTGLTPDIV